MIKVLSLGDACTIGEGVKQSERWPMQLASHLRKENLKVDTPLIIAVTGWTTANLMGAIEKSRLEEQYDLVTLLIGVNDQHYRTGLENPDYPCKSTLYLNVEEAFSFARIVDGRLKPSATFLFAAGRRSYNEDLILKNIFPSHATLFLSLGGTFQSRIQCCRTWNWNKR